MKDRTFWLIVGALGVGALIVYLFTRYPGAVSNFADGANLVYLLILLLVIGSGVLFWRRLSIKFAFGSIAAWALIFAALLLAYSFKDDLDDIWNRIAGTAAPHSPIKSGPRQLTIRAAGNGHFYLDARVNGEPVRFLVDTGASDISLSPADARRAGLDPDRLTYSRVYRTANGTVRGAPVRLRRLKIGPLAWRDVPASVNKAAMHTSLLGQSFLARFRGYSVKRGVMTLQY